MKRRSSTTEVLEELLVELEAWNYVQKLSANGEAFVLAADGTFLGLIADPDHPESILNEAGKYGSPSELTSIFNLNGPFGSPTGAYSLRNPRCVEPPFIFTEDAANSGCIVTANPDFRSADFKVVESERFLSALDRDWREVARGCLGTGSIKVPVSV